MNGRRENGPGSREAGVTLVELLIVLVVIGVGLIALSGVQTQSSRDVFATGRRTRAVALGQDRMEAARGLGYLLAVSDSGQADGFVWKSYVDSVAVGLRRVTVTISWAEQGSAQSVQFVNLVSAR